MKIVQRDEQLKKKEQAKKELDAKLEAQKAEYLDSLKQNVRFQKFVVDGIIRKNIDQLSNLNNIKAGDFEEMGKLAFQAMASKKQLERILSELLN